MKRLTGNTTLISLWGPSSGQKKVSSWKYVISVGSSEMPFFGGWVLDDLGSALPVIQNRLNNFLSFDLRERRRLDAHLRPMKLMKVKRTKSPAQKSQSLFFAWSSLCKIMFCSFNFISPYCANTESSLAQLSAQDYWHIWRFRNKQEWENNYCLWITPSS